MSKALTGVSEIAEYSSLRAHIDNERMRLELPVAAPPGRAEHTEAVPDGGLGEITAQLRDETEIRGLLADQPGLACDRAHAWVHRLQPQGARARCCRPTGCWWPP